MHAVMTYHFSVVHWDLFHGVYGKPHKILSPYVNYISRSSLRSKHHRIRNGFILLDVLNHGWGIMSAPFLCQQSSLMLGMEPCQLMSSAELCGIFFDTAVLAWFQLLWMLQVKLAARMTDRGRRRLPSTSSGNMKKVKSILFFNTSIQGEDLFVDISTFIFHLCICRWKAFF